ncbi:MAG TPA: 6-carboxytetrahydropterin synthase, partial [Nitrospiraceae bacterium]
VLGGIDPNTGMVTDIGVLDRVIQEKIGKVFEGQDLRHVLNTQEVTGESLAKAIWDLLVSFISGGKLEKVRLVQTRDLTFEYSE